MNKKSINIISTIVLVLLWMGIFTVSLVVLLISDIIKHFENGILVLIFAMVYILALFVPIIFRKKLIIAKSISLTMIVSAVMAVVINVVTFFGVYMYISEYSKDKWDAHPRLRICMVDDLEREHQVIGMTEEEVKALLGEPEDVPEWGQRRFEYYAGDSGYDPYTYDVLFENGVAVETRIREH